MSAASDDDVGGGGEGRVIGDGIDVGHPPAAAAAAVAAAMAAVSPPAYGKPGSSPALSDVAVVRPC